MKEIFRRQWVSKVDGLWFETQLELWEDDGLYKVTTRAGHQPPLEQHTFTLRCGDHKLGEIPASGQIPDPFLEGTADDQEVLERLCGMVFPKKGDILVEVTQRIVIHARQLVFADSEMDAELKAAGRTQGQVSGLQLRVEDLDIEPTGRQVLR